jgi:hypothetical protein
MRKDKALYITDKQIPLSVKHEEVRRLEIEMPDLAYKLSGLNPESAMFIPTGLIMTMKDEEFRRFIRLPFTFLMHPTTLKIVQNRMDKLGEGYVPDPINKSISTEHGKEGNQSRNGLRIVRGDNREEGTEDAKSEATE